MEKPWLKHYDSDVPTTIDYPRIPLDRFLADSAAKHPEHTATIFGSAVGSRLMDAQLTYRQLDDLVNRFAAGLQELGVSKGDRVAIMLPNCPQFIIAAYATWRIGGDRRLLQPALRRRARSNTWSTTREPRPWW